MIPFPNPMKRLVLFSVILLGIGIPLAACGQGLAGAATPTLDACAAENLPAEVDKFNDLMREFDDAAALAASTPRERLTDPITELQRIRRSAEDLPAPPCLEMLKKTQLAHMNVVIQTLMTFVGGADQEAVNQGVATARQLHDQYLVEMAKLLGMTVAPLPTGAPTP